MEKARIVGVLREARGLKHRAGKGLCSATLGSAKPRVEGQAAKIAGKRQNAFGQTKRDSAKEEDRR
jgi:uncharacterized protein YjbJ (UPF0337 family)